MGPKRKSRRVQEAVAKRARRQQEEPDQGPARAGPDQSPDKADVVGVPGPVSEQQQDDPGNMAKQGLGTDTVNFIESLSAISPLPAITSSLGEHVSHSLRQKIISGSFVDLNSLNSNIDHDQSKLGVAVDANGQLTMRQNIKKENVDMEKWTDLFLIYISIFVSAHPERTQELLKYMNIIRTGQKRFGGVGWRSYDEQFRYRLSLNPNQSWVDIDTELWLTYMHAPVSSQVAANSAKKCFDYNFKGICLRTVCSYLHRCLRCSSNHPQGYCSRTKAATMHESE